MLQYIAYFNPRTYTTAFFRTIILEKTSLTTNHQLVEEQLAFKIGNFIITPLISMGIVIIFGLVFLRLSTYVFARVDFSRINRSKSKEADIFS